MLHHMRHITRMARGDSGRIVVEIEPEMKRRLYSALALSGSTLKDWFLKAASEFCADAGQLSLFTRPQLRAHRIAGGTPLGSATAVGPHGQEQRPQGNGSSE